MGVVMQPLIQDMEADQILEDGLQQHSKGSLNKRQRIRTCIRYIHTQLKPHLIASYELTARLLFGINAGFSDGNVRTAQEVRAEKGIQKRQ